MRLVPLVLVLATVPLAGCFGTQAPQAAPSATVPDGAAAPPPGVAELLEAYRAGRELPLQAILARSEAHFGVASSPARPPGVTDPVAAVLDLFDALERPVPPEAMPGILQLATLPPDLRAAIAVLAQATADSNRLLDGAFVDGKIDWAQAFPAQRVKLAAVESTLPTLRAHAGGLGFGPIVSVCDVVGIDVEGAADTHQCNYTLQIDLGGDDRYVNNAGGNFLLYTSMLAVDAAGRDTYATRIPDHSGATGGAMFGLGTLVDLAGDDTYDTYSDEGAGVNGAANAEAVGFLADLGGSDTIRGTTGLHGAVNGGGWIGAGHLVLVGGPDTVEAHSPTAGALNGGGFIGVGNAVGLGGARTYTIVAEDLGEDQGVAGNGGGVAAGAGLLVDDGLDTRYEAWLGNISAANGGGVSGQGLLLDLGGGHDTYFGRAGISSGLNGGAAGDLPALLYDDGGRDTYDDDAARASRVDETVRPKGRLGAQVDGRTAVSPYAASSFDWDAWTAAWPADAKRVLDAARAARDHGAPLVDLNAIPLAMMGEAAGPLPALPAGTLPQFLARLTALDGLALEPSAALALATVPADLQAALAQLLAAYLRAEQITRDVLADLEPGAVPPAALLVARGELLAAVDATHPVFQRYAGQQVLPEALDECESYNIDLSGKAATYECTYRFQVALGGDSVYKNNAGGAASSVGFLLDAAGNDVVLGPTPDPTRNATRLGVAGGSAGGLGFLADLAGDDRYTPQCPHWCSANGAATGGVGTLVDYAGNDVYTVHAAAPKGASSGNGAASVGHGFLVDYAGNDAYDGRANDSSVFNGADFFGGTAFLYDGAGDDSYHGEVGVHGTVNGGSTIGAAMLLDAGGNDRYWGFGTHHAMTNGAGFFASPGAWLIDVSGDDAYTGAAYVEIATNGRYYTVGRCPLPYGCAKGVAFLLDLFGRDAYIEWEQMPGAHGHDKHDGSLGANQTMQMTPMPPPAYDRFVFPKGDLGGQIDVNVSPY